MRSSGRESDVPAGGAAAASGVGTFDAHPAVPASAIKTGRSDARKIDATLPFMECEPASELGLLQVPLPGS